MGYAFNYQGLSDNGAFMGKVCSNYYTLRYARAYCCGRGLDTLYLVSVYSLRAYCLESIPECSQVQCCNIRDSDI